MLRKKEQGFTLIGAVILAAVLGASIDVYGIINYYVVKAKAKSESKASAIDSESALAELVATKFNSLANPSGCAGITADSFSTALQTAIFSDDTVTLSMVKSGEAEPAAAEANGYPNWMVTAAGSCKSGPSFPANSAASGVYIFCVKIGKRGNAANKSGTSFLQSELAFVQFRLKLMSQSTSQNTKVFGPAISCMNWIGGSENERQIKLSYRIIWKKPNGTPQEVFSHLGSKMINVAELRGS